MTRSRTLLISAGMTAMIAAASASAQHGRSAAAPRPAAVPALPRVVNTTGTAHDVLHAFGLGPNAGLNTGAPLTPRTNIFPLAQNGFSGVAAGMHTFPGTTIPPGQGAPNTWFPSQTTGFSLAPLFPYASVAFPYGYGFTAREPSAETAQELEWERDMFFGRPDPRPPDKNVATMDVRVPASANVWVAGARTGQRGMLRTFLSPSLEPDRNYTYDIRARWTEGGKEVEQTRQVSVRAGQTVKVDFSGK